jgi:hypothetical protein
MTVVQNGAENGSKEAKIKGEERNDTRQEIHSRRKL